VIYFTISIQTQAEISIHAFKIVSSGFDFSEIGSLHEGFIELCYSFNSSMREI